MIAKRSFDGNANGFGKSCQWSFGDEMVETGSVLKALLGFESIALIKTLIFSQGQHGIALETADVYDRRQ